MVADLFYNVFIALLYAGLSTVCLILAGLDYLEYHARLRGKWILLGVLMYVALAVFFLLLSISGGSKPQIPRRDLAVLIRSIAFGALVVGYALASFRAKAQIVIQWKHDGDTGREAQRT